jgi:DNA-binding NarL/FixJ family response regulator
MTEQMLQKAERPQARVFLVDDHALVREHLTALLQAEPDLAVCGEAEDAPTALALIRQQKPNLVILDLSLKQSNGLDLLKDLKELQPHVVVLVLSMHDSTFYAERALQAGALGYITKEEATTNILPAIRRVLRGQPYLSDRMATQMIKKPARAGRTVAEEVPA